MLTGTLVDCHVVVNWGQLSGEECQHTNINAPFVMISSKLNNESQKTP